jgi:hypothetical protein
VLIGVTAGLGVITAVVGIFFTQWTSVSGASHNTQDAGFLGASHNTHAGFSGASHDTHGWIRPTFNVAANGGSVGLEGAF